ncbi:hypothetical protein [Coralliovum pocilloporae]|uniref:hypothetical protein n=1 Tax=Coralliovum pocilloporae TaxID=3066369 RepID=UPI0033071A9B
MFASALKTTLALTVLATSLAVIPAHAGDGGGRGGDRGGAHWTDDFVTVHNADGSSRTIRRTRTGGREIIKRNKRGNVVDRRNVNRSNRPWASSYDPETGTRVTAIGNDDGSRTVITISPFGLIGVGVSF